MITFEIACELNDSLINDLISETSNNKYLCFDFSNAGFASAYAITFLTSFLNKLCEEKKIKLIFSSNSSLLYYCSRMGFFRELNQRIEITPREARNPQYVEDYRKTKDTILEVTPITEQDIVGLINYVLNTMCNILGYDKEIVGNLAIILSELTNNVIDHSLDNRNCFMSLQTYAKVGFAELSVIDSGIGIMKSLNNSNYYYIDNDRKAILLALKEGVSRFTSVGRGIGLFTCCELITKYQGSFLLRSGRGQVYLLKNKMIPTDVAFFPGTQIRIRLPYIGNKYILT